MIENAWVNETGKCEYCNTFDCIHADQSIRAAHDVIELRSVLDPEDIDMEAMVEWAESEMMPPAYMVTLIDELDGWINNA